ncbi:thioredoxin family protein [Ascidiimonas aurantiaca]|uniref:thioredoxin family protein n=1 Tax=Ascidiimonas aurantiaca TaxID=1685432 RepID=UPI0030EE54ED
MRYKKLVFTLLLTGFFLNHALKAQGTEEITWLNFTQLEDSLKKKPKKVLISFYADWCNYCKKMERVAFSKKEIIKTLRDSYYAVRMNVESTDTIVFDGRIFNNPQHKVQRNAIHEIPLLLASREGSPFSLPAMVILTEEFTVRDRYFGYQPPEKLIKALQK